MGSKSKPSPPSPGEVSRQSIQAQIQSLPEIFRAQQEFAPQFLGLEAELQREFAPEVGLAQLETAQQLTPGFLDLSEQISGRLTPEVAAGQEAILGFLGGGPTEEFIQEQRGALQEFLDPTAEVLTPTQRRFVEQDIRGAQSERGLGLFSPLGSIQEAAGLENLRQQIRAQRFQARTGVAGSILGEQTRLGQTGLTAAGRTAALPGLAGIGQQFGQQVQTPGQFVQNVSPEQVFGLTQSNFAQQMQAQSQPSAFGQIAGGLAGSFLGPLGSAAGSKVAGTLFA